jgi:hypothetical protein
VGDGAGRLYRRVRPVRRCTKPGIVDRRPRRSGTCRRAARLNRYQRPGPTRRPSGHGPGPGPHGCADGARACDRPTVGALLLAHLSWPWLFLINLPIGALGLVLGWKYVPIGRRESTGRLDLLGLALVSAGAAALTYGITEAAQQDTILRLPIAACLIGGTAALVAFARRSRRRCWTCTWSPTASSRPLPARPFSAARPCSAVRPSPGAAPWQPCATPERIGLATTG